MLNRNIIDQVIYELFKDDLEGTPKYKRSFNYSELVNNWEDDRPVPAEQVMLDKWAEMTSEKELKHPYYYKYQNSEWVLDTSKKQELRAAVDGMYDSESDIIYQTDFFTQCKEIAEQSKEPMDFLISLHAALNTESTNNKNKRAALASKSMQELMDIYNS